MTARAPTLSLTAVCRTFGTGARAVGAVRGVSLELHAGEAVCIMGPSGSGKSTLLSIMGGLLEPDRGEVAIAGRRLADLSQRARCELRRRQVGFVFQRFNLMGALSAAENVELGLHLAGVAAPEGRRRAAGVLERFGLGPRGGALPRDLSGGEQQRVALARALAPGPVLLLADEPTGNLDSANGRRVVELIRAHVRGTGAAAVVVTHDRRVSEAMDHCLWMEDGVLGGFEDRPGAAA